ncbi:MAG: tetratricopeptide repeat protein, partial [Candidatus Rhabdochlamydia sp.]
TIQLLNGEVYTPKELYLKVIDLNPTDEDSYFNLATLLIKNEDIELLNGEIYTQKELYLKVIDLNPADEDSYFNLATLLAKNEEIELLSGETYTQKELYLEVLDLNSKNQNAYINLAACLKKDEIITFFNGETYTKKDLYCKLIELNPQDAEACFNLANLLKDDETIQISNEGIYTKKELYCKGIDQLSSGKVPSQAKKYLQAIYIQEIEKNPNSIESYFNLITISQGRPIHLNNGMEVDSEFYFKEVVHLDPINTFSARFASGFLSIASHLSHKTKSLLQELNNKFTIEDEFLRARLLKEGASLTLKNGEVFSAKALYEHALPLLSSLYLKRQGDREVGDYLSSRKPIILQDGVKFTKLMAYTYAYQQHLFKSIFTKIGDALHPEERILLDGKFYDKRGCYEEASAHKKNPTNLLRRAESFYPHEQLRKGNLFHKILEKVYQMTKDRLGAYAILARMLSGYELKGPEFKYLCIFGEYLKEHPYIQDEGFPQSINSRYENLDHLGISDELYLTKKQEFLLEFLKYRPSCEEAYVALATSFQDAFIIHDKSYASKEALYLKAIDINPEYSLPYFLLGKELFHQKIENIELLNGVTLSCKQLLMRAVQLGTYEARAYHLAAMMMDDRDGILLFDEKTILSRGDLFIRAFELDITRVIDLKNFIHYIKRNQKLMGSC